MLMHISTRRMNPCRHLAAAGLTENDGHEIGGQDI